MTMFRAFVRSRLERQLTRRLAGFCDDDWKAACVIVAPHPDDETLGCGGVACKKIAAGAPVHFAFVTDGSASHSGHSASSLRELREQEAIDAVSRLGAGAGAVTFLRFPDGSADGHVDEIAGALVALFDDLSPEQVFVPHELEPPADHKAVWRAVRNAVALRRAPVTVFEYPVWFWYHWPWVPVFGDGLGMWRQALRQTLATGFGRGAVSRLNTRVCVGDVIALKEAALAAHVTQTRKPEGRPDWPVLSEIGRGGFLERLVSGFEFFNRYTLYQDAAEPGAAEARPPAAEGSILD